MAKRIFEIAKELGIDSKAIVAKCRAEDIPESLVKGHMSSVSAGLEATIREWFTTHEDASAKAVEKSAKVDLEQVKIKKPRSRKAKSESAQDDTGSGDATATIVAEPPPPDVPVEQRHARTHTAPPPISTLIHPPVTPKEPLTEEPIVEAPATPPARRAAPSSIISLTPPKPSAPMPPRGPITVTPVAPPSGPTPAISEPKTARPAPEPAAPVAKSPPATDEPRHRRPEPPSRTTTPAPMNVPTRPSSITPAGPKLEVKTPVRLTGPKVVRVEAPEVIEAPRARRPAAGGIPTAKGPRAGSGAGVLDDDDRGRSRSPRNKAGAAPGSAAAKRSSGIGVPDRRRGRSGNDWVGAGPGVFSEQDLAEREARLARAGGFLKKHKQELRKSDTNLRAQSAAETGGKVRIAAPFTIKDLSEATGVKGSEIVKKLFMQGIMKKINDGIEVEKAIEVLMDFDIELEVVEFKTAEESVSAAFEQRDSIDQRARGPVVTILGHVDHGKTSLLDKIRNANVAAGEAGGITQKTSAFVAEVEVEGTRKQVVFLDTPGHEAFTSMRARGAKMTDVVVLVVSAPEGVMPQTVESINHAKAAKVPIVVALNKIDRPDATEAQVQKTLGQLAAAGLNPTEWGGDTEVVRTSATTGQGIQQLLETLDYQAQLLDLKADFDGPAQGTVIEAKTEEGRGAVANILIQQGKLKVGDFVVMGRAFGRIRDLTDDKGKRLREATPPMPVQISGIDEICDAGDKFYVVDSLKKAQEAAEQRRHRERQAALAQPKLTLDSLFTQIQSQETDIKEIKIVLKTDQQGTVDVLKGECEKIKTDEIKVRVIDAGVGGITESNVLLADASKAIIIGFNVIPSGKARALAEQKGVEIRTYEVIYDITDDLKKAAEGMLAPELRQEVLGHAEVRAVFRVTKVGNIAGCYVTDGIVQRDALIRVTRQGVVIENNRKLAQLKRLKDDAKEVRAGMECGMKIDGYDDIKEGDVLECYKQVEVKRTL